MPLTSVCVFATDENMKDRHIYLLDVSICVALSALLGLDFSTRTMQLLLNVVALAATLTSFLPIVKAQCLNQVAVYNPNLRTMSSNTTWFIVPVPKAAAQNAVDSSFPGYGLKLLDVPNDPNVFPEGFPAGFHPVMVSSGRTDDIRISALQIDGALLQGTIYVTYVSKGGSATPLAAQASSYSKLWQKAQHHST